MSIPSEDVVSFLERGGEEYLVRGYGWVRPDKQGLEDIRNISVKTKDGTPIYVKDIAKVEFGSQIKRPPLIKDLVGKTIPSVANRHYRPIAWSCLISKT